MSQKNYKNKKITKYFEMNKNRSTTYQNLWDAAKAVLRENLQPIYKYVNVYIKKKERSQINSLTFHIKQLGEKRASQI